MMNLNQLKSVIQKVGNPEQIFNQLQLQNPILNNLISLAKSGNTTGVETFARNLFKEQGRDFDKEYTNFRNNLGL